MNQANHEEATAHRSTRHITFPASTDEEGQETPTLEGHIYVPTDGTLHPGAALLHANPAAGGTMDMEVMIAIEQALVERGFATLRYNSRGVGDSEGAISTAGERRLVAPEGAPETADVAAALDFLGMQEGVDGRRLALVGHSFGARISLSYLNKHPDDERVRGVVCIGLPVAWRDLTHLGQWPHPKLFITGDRDDFSPPDLLDKFVAGLPEPSTQVVLKNTGHFFEEREDDMAAVVVHFLSTVLAETQ